ncbi:MAG: hypothetical protein JJU10_07745 [Idiomarina sp.]|nr:hypothetical protein [Idiomarina sp.]
MKRLVTVVVLLTLLGGCAGGTIGGLIPAPKILNGSLDGMRYTAPNETFSVVAPVESSSEWLYTKVHEATDTAENILMNSVIFELPYDMSYYSTIVYQYEVVPQIEPWMLFSNLYDVWVTEMKRHGGKVEVVVAEDREIASYDGHYGVANVNFTDGSDIERKLIISFTTCEALICAVTLAELNSSRRGNAEFPESIKTGSWERFNDYVASLNLKNPEDAE